MTITEAAACGTPAVATRIAGHADAVVDGRTGLLVDDDGGARRRARPRARRRRAPRARSARARSTHAAAVHVGGDGARHARGARGRGAAAPSRVSDRPSVAARREPSRRASPRAAARLPRARAARVRPAAAHRAGQGRRRHEAVPLPRPGRLLARAPSMWDPNIGMGTVTHQNIGYLFPMGPYYWLLDTARRARLGRAAALARLAPVLRRRSGVLYLLRTFGLRGPGVVVAALAYMLTPYALDYAARISVLLLPWAALPWMIALDPQGVARRRLALSRALRARRAGRRRRERDRARSSPASARCCGSCTRGWSTREVDVAARARRRRDASAC